MDITLTILAGLAIAGGVYGEHHFGSAAASAAIQIEDISEANVAGAQREAKQASRESESLRNQNLTLEAEILKLRQSMADRHLTTEQQRRIAAKLDQFAGQKVNLIMFAREPESIGISADLGHALSKAKWVGRGFLEEGETRVIPAGMLVEFRPEANEATKKAASVLVSELKSEHVSVTGPQVSPPAINHMWVGNVPDVNNPAIITITVGKKP